MTPSVPSMVRSAHAQPSALLVLVGMAMVLAGCAVNQKKETALYLNVLKQNVPKRPAPYSSDQPLSLTRAMTLANAYNEQLAIGGETYVQMLIRKDLAASRFFPTIGLEPSGAWQAQTHVAPGNPLIQQFVPTKAVDVPLQANLDVNPLGNLQNVASAAAAAKASKQDLLALQSRLLLDVARTYYRVLESQQQVQVLKQSVNVQQHRLNDIKAKQEAGVARPLDVSQTEAEVANTRVQLVQARNDVKNARAALAYLIGVTRVGGNLDDQFHIPAKLPSTETLMKVAYRHRYDLKAASDRLTEAWHDLQAAWDEYYPSITLNADYFLHRESFPPDVDWQTMVALHLPIFTFGRIHQDVREAWSKVRQAHLAESLLSRDIHKQLTVVLNDLNNNRKRIAGLKIELRAATQAYQQADQEYQAGTATNLERLTALNRELTTKLKLVTAQLNRKTLFLELEQTIGRLAIHTVVHPAQALQLPAPPAKAARASKSAVPLASSQVSKQSH